MIYFLDTNIVSYILKHQLPVETFIANAVASGNELFTPAIAYYETLRWLVITNAGQRADEFNRVIGRFPVVQMTMRTYDIAARIYANLSKRGNIIEDTDILIAASAIEHGAVLLTNNEAHFKRVDGLVFEKMS